MRYTRHDSEREGTFFMLAHDLDLNRTHIQALSSRDALAAFFTDLGYDTIVQQVHTMGIANENLKAAITYIERVASEPSAIAPATLCLC